MVAKTAFRLLPVWLALTAQAQDPGPAMQTIRGFAIDRTEVTIGQFRRFVEATGTVTQAERAGGGSTYEGGWQQRAGWTWRSPYGQPGADDEPAVHITQPEARAFCRWAGKRLPTDAEWGEAAYVERRPDPPAPLVSGRRYPWPTGDSPQGAQCLDDCGTGTSRTQGHVRVGTTRPGVNGLHDMGGNVWEWVEGGAEPRTRGGSWWYGAAQMRDEHVQSKPAQTAVVYIGFHCVR